MWGTLSGMTYLGHVEVAICKELANDHAHKSNFHILNVKPDLPDGEYLVAFGYQVLGVKKEHGRW